MGMLAKVGGLLSNLPLDPAQVFGILRHQRNTSRLDKA
jgi:hypothetical protein